MLRRRLDRALIRAYDVQMPVGDFVPGPRFGVMVDSEFWRTRTKRGARKLWLRVRDLSDPVEVEPGREVLAARIERRRVAEEWRFRLPPYGGPEAGVREPRRPLPSDRGAAAEPPCA